MLDKTAASIAAAPTQVQVRPKQITGHDLNRWVAKAGATTRAFVADDLRAGRLNVTEYTARQSRALARASFGYTNTVAKLTADERERVERGSLTLAELHRKHRRPLSDTDLDGIVARAGANRVWLALIRATPQRWSAASSNRPAGSRFKRSTDHEDHHRRRFYHSRHEGVGRYRTR
jgi:hypothetical protein